MRNHNGREIGLPAGIIHRRSGFAAGEHKGKQWKLDGREGKQLIGRAHKLQNQSFPRGWYSNGDVKEAEIAALAIEN